MTKPVILPSGKVLGGRTEASARQNQQDRVTKAEPQELTKLLARIPLEIATEFRTIRQMPAAHGKADLRDGFSSTVCKYARDTLDAYRACHAANVSANSIRDLSSAAAVKAIAKFYTRDSGSGQNARRILEGIRALIRRMGADTPKHMRTAIRELAATPRKDDGEELPSLERCMEAALDEFQEALMMIHGGKPKRGKTRLRDAAIFAIEMATNFRRGEFNAITVDVVFFSKLKAKVKIVIPEAASKVREVQIGIITDERVIEMMRILIEENRSGHLFETNRGTPFISVGPYKALRRTSHRSTGVPLNFNKARRIRVTDQTNLQAMRGGIRNSANSQQPEQAYSRHADDIGIDECRRKLRQYGRNSDERA